MREENRKFILEITDSTKDYLARSLAPVVARIDALEKATLAERITQLESRAANAVSTVEFNYRGKWSSDKQYSPDAVVRYRRSLWVCRSSTRDEPDKSSAWQILARGECDD